MKTTLKMKTTTIKTLLLLLVMHLTISCSNNPSTDSTAQKIATNEKNADTIIIKGTVRTVAFGKDGYTADVQTDTQGVYAALVSIINVGGREKYKPCEVGDKASFKGVFFRFKTMFKQLKVTEIISIEASRTQLLISPHFFQRHSDWGFDC